MSQAAAKSSPRASVSPPATTDVATGVVLVFTTVLIWGVQFPIAKSAFDHVDPFHLALARYGVPMCLLVSWLVFTEGMSSLRFDRRAGAATVVGVIGMCGSPALVFGGLAMTRPEIAAIIIAIQPILTAIVLWAWKGKRPDGFSLLCIAVAFIGVFTVITGWSTDLGGQPRELIGNAMIALGALCWVIYTISGERFADWSVLRFTALTMLPGSLGHLVLVAALTYLGVIVTPGLAQWQAVSWQAGFLIFVGVLAAMLMWNAGNKRIGSLNAMLFVNLIPVVTFLVQYWQGARFTPVELFGAALVVLALLANNLALRARAAKARRVRKLASG